VKVPLDQIADPGSDARAVLDQLEPSRLPEHVAIIMDGNGRWATARRLPRVEGHRAGIRAVRETIETAARLDIPVLTLYAFSTENWKRPRHEVLTLMGLLKEYIKLELKTFLKHDLRFRPIGRIDHLEPSVQRELERAVEETSSCRGPLIQIALNYSGRQELTDALRVAVREASEGRLDPADIDEEWIEDHLTTHGQPDPDLLIRTYLELPALATRLLRDLLRPGPVAGFQPGRVPQGPPRLPAAGAPVRRSAAGGERLHPTEGRQWENVRRSL
jgi:undecaprenyl diphosphate synthase